MAAAGMHVFPCASGGKRPLTRNGQNDASVDAEQIRAWWSEWPTANIGLACEKSQIFVVDIDCKPNKNGEATPGFASWNAISEPHGQPDTFTVSTWSGGLHLYFRMPEHALKNSASKLGPGIDTRGNGYVIAPPSVIDGKTYEVVKAVGIKPLPQWIIDLLERREKPVRVHPTVVPSGGTVVDPPNLAAPAEVVERVRVLAGGLAGAPEGSGNDEAARVAFMCGQYVGAGQIDDTTVIGILLDAIAGWSYSSGMDARVMESTIIKQVAVGSDSPRPWEASRPTGRPVPVVAQGSVARSPGETDGAGAEETPTGDAVRASDWGTDYGQARYIMRCIGGMLYVIGLGWFVWDGTRWLSVDHRRIACIIQAFYKEKFDHFLEKYKAGLDEDDNKRAKAYAKFMNSSRVAGIIKAMESVEPVEADLLDAHPDLLNTPGGVVDLRSGSLSGHDPSLLMTKITKGSYRPGFTHRDWDMALSALPDDTRDYMQVRVGQAATGHIPNSDDSLFLQGEGANGKSMMTSDGVMRALGDYAMLASPNLILARNDSGGASPERASVRAARFVLVEELPEGRSLSVDELKRITGTSQITARKLYQDEITFTTSHTLFVTTNYLPAVSEADDGSWRRLCLINFPYRFRSDPDVSIGERRGDSGLKGRVRNGSGGQHDAIVTWAVEGAMRWYADPGQIEEERRPNTVMRDTMLWRMSADRIMAYISDRIDASPGSVVPRADLYQDFCSFLTASGHAKWSQETFFSRLRKHDRFKRFMTEEVQTANHDILSRPLPAGSLWTSGLPALSRRVRGFSGIAFRVD
jgi:P4 family phage/plasmid primase-like protien